MYEGQRVGVVIPAYNEEPFIGEVIESIPEFVDRVIVVDDASTDGTWVAILDHAGTVPDDLEAGTADGPGAPATTIDSRVSLSDGGRPVDGRVVPIRHEDNQGRGAAVKTGYRFAIRDGHDVVAVMDGDGQMDPDVLHRIVEPVVAGRADYTKGNRLVGRDHVGEMPPWRLLGNVILTVLTGVASSYWGVRDPQNGYTAISAEALDRLSLPDLYDGYGFLNDLLIHLGARGMCVEDVPTEAIYDEESSGIRYGTFVPSLSLLLLRGLLWRLWVTYLSP